MDNVELHLNQYKHNKNFISYGISNTKEKFCDWEVTVYFYATIHLVEAVMCKKIENVEIKSHEDRRRLMYSHKETFGTSQNSYRMLYDLARTARYNGITKITDIDVYQAQSYFEDVEQKLLKYINS